MKSVSESESTSDDDDLVATDQWLLAFYDELRRMAQGMLAGESPGQTLQATALVHEAFVRLAGRKLGRDATASDQDFESTLATPVRWENRAHFFSAAAETMRRVLIDRARKKKAAKRGGGNRRVDVDLQDWAASVTPVEMLALDDALGALEKQSKLKADVVKLRYFVGLSVDETAKALGISSATVKRNWAYSKAWLRREMNRSE